MWMLSLIVISEVMCLKLDSIILVSIRMRKRDVIYTRHQGPHEISLGKKKHWIAN